MKPQTELRPKYQIGLSTFLLLVSAGQFAFTVAAPSQVTDVALSKTLDQDRPGLRVTWAPQYDSNISGYHVEYKRTGNLFWTNQIFVTVSATSTVLTELAAGTQYDVRVRAMSTTGHGQWSAVQTERTYDAPSQVIGVALFKAVRNGSPSLRVTWTAPQAHEAISQYQVQYRITGATDWGDQVIVQPNSTSTLLPKLYGVTKYDVRVRALSTIENGEWSAVQTERTYFDAPPNIPTPPSELDIANIPVCCAGVQFNLDYLDDPAIHVQASIDGTLHPANQVVIDGNSLYIMGLQAGTEYSLNIMLSNKFGSAWTDTSVTPLLGSPSTPTVTLTPTSGSVTIQLTTMYPGTREESLQYSISLTASPHSRWQVEQHTIPVTSLTTPVSGSTEVALGPGNYTVTVTVTNQHGSTMSAPQAVTVPACYPPSTELLPAVIALSAALFIIATLLAVATFTAIWMFQRSRKSAISNCTKHYTTATNEAQYKECGGVTRSHLAVEKNPAYQTMDAGTTKL